MKQMKKVITCVGTRPNFVKVTQLEKFFSQAGIQHKIIHTGQHYDAQMSDVFFKELGIKTPEVYFKLKPSSQLGIITQIMTKVETFFKEESPDLVLVPGDVNSSMACALVANRMGIPVGHIESGLRSDDRSMPEEINRIIIDDLSDLYFVTEPSGIDNLIKEGKNKKHINFVGNTMIDSLLAFLPEINQSKIATEYNLVIGDFVLVTFHRPHNVDIKDNFSTIIELLNQISKEKQVVFPIHPRTRKRLEEFSLIDKLSPDVLLIPPLGYFDFIYLIKNSLVCVTDSGGIQEETTFLQVPCLTVRPNTERPITITKGSNTLVELDVDQIMTLINKIIEGSYQKGQVPELWDGSASKRIVEQIADYFKA
jgi:UDP-N-acetylglucosamine 2-epimerase (non-hydrolysing)